MTSNLSLPRLVIFDCDGTLVDSALSTRMFYNSIKASLGLDPMDPEEEAYTFVQTVPRGLKRIVPPELQERAFALAGSTDWIHFAEASQLQEGVLEFIRFS